MHPWYSSVHDVTVTNLDSPVHTPAWVVRLWYSSSDRWSPCHQAQSLHRRCDRKGGLLSYCNTWSDLYHLQNRENQNLFLHLLISIFGNIKQFLAYIFTIYLWELSVKTVSLHITVHVLQILSNTFRYILLEFFLSNFNKLELSHHFKFAPTKN